MRPLGFELWMGYSARPMLYSVADVQGKFGGNYYYTWAYEVNTTAVGAAGPGWHLTSGGIANGNPMPDTFGMPKFKDVNRGVAILGDRVFFATTDAHLICLNRLTGGLMWDVNMPQTKGAFGSSSAPMVVGNLVIAGVSGGDSPLLGFLVAYHATTGEEAWRFHTVPKPDEPAAARLETRGLLSSAGHFYCLLHKL